MYNIALDQIIDYGEKFYMGTIRKYEGKKGTIWRVREEVPADIHTGKRRWRWVIGPTKKDVERQVADIRSAVGKGQYQEWSREPLAEYLLRWLAIKEGDLRGSSHMRARRDIRKHIVPVLGHLPLSEIRPTHIQALIAEKQGTYAASSIVRMHAVLKAALALAFDQELIPRNPCMLVKLPKIVVDEPRVWTPAEARIFLAACEDHPWGPFFRVMLFTGMRKGEMLGLRWSDVDLERGTLSVRRTQTVDKENRITLNAPKSAAGRRTVKLTSSCVDALTRHRAAQGAIRLAASDWRDFDYVFPRADGHMWYAIKPNNELTRIIADNDLPSLRVHDLRHTSATLALSQGVDARVVQMRLGHATIAMTRRYQHPSVEMQEDAADRMEKALG